MKCVPEYDNDNLFTCYIKNKVIELNSALNIMVFSIRETKV